MPSVLPGRSFFTVSDRAQSEVVGIILLTAVVVVLVTGAGAVFLSSLESQTDRDPRANIDSSVDATTITLAHQGGDSFDASQVEVILRGDGEFRQTLEDGELRRGSSDDRFEPGDRWQSSGDHEQSGVVRLLVVDRGTGTVIHEATHELEE